ncbi:zinc finger CCCH domain-containing protein 3 isoform X2 [Toxorhynchites rutilus septentrionalis]|uniref:zinc finger CCCH domain-containing protein 3 isoform X2 n=1 Tax=Toxorhynchites rutilus septentrionalis TaxID=329112 RepID=UPI0024799FA5|nr:zinc finger CCCH domain-containing protein 3 isoform X2 [Toxorhynchites rutilus septentrionalis]
MEDTESRSKIFINPVFKKAHINPNFLLEKNSTINHAPTSDKPTSMQHSPNIHFNPAFLERIHQQQQQEVGRTNSTLTAIASAVQPNNPIIKHTKRKLVRASSAIPANLEKSPLAPLVKISKNKLVRSSISTVATANSPRGVTLRDVKKPYKVINSTSQLYKLDRRPVISGAVTKSKSLVRKISPQKFAIKDRKLLKLRNIRTPLKIANVSYKESLSKPQLSGRFKLVNSHKSNYATNSVRSKDTCLKIRGTTFLLDPSGNKLRKVPSQLDAESKNAKFERVYIGGQPYVSKSDGTFERSKAEWWTKQKSINNLLNRNIKCNVPCPIFRRSGICKNFSRGQCPKLHDPKHIIICPKFLRGECTNTDCLLSHNVSLEKMPVCRFFLEGRCSKNDCPYLHKKVSEKERICGDFLNGYCSLADKCQNRHIFICPDFDRAGVCGKTKCPYPHGRKNVQSKDKESKSKRTDVTHEEESELCEDTSAPKARYFFSNCDDTGDDELSNAQKAQRKRLLRQVEKMKRKHEDNETADVNMLGVHHEGTTNEEDNQTNSNNTCEELDEREQDTPFRKRVKLGTLPSFIPI